MGRFLQTASLHEGAANQPIGGQGALPGYACCHAGNTQFPTGSLILTFLFAITNAGGRRCARCVLRLIFVREVQSWLSSILLP